MPPPVACRSSISSTSRARQAIGSEKSICRSIGLTLNVTCGIGSSNAPSYGGYSGQRCSTAAVRSVNGRAGATWSHVAAVLPPHDPVEDVVEGREPSDETGDGVLVELVRRYEREEHGHVGRHAERGARVVPQAQLADRRLRLRRGNDQGGAAWHARGA